MENQKTWEDYDAVRVRQYLPVDVFGALQSDSVGEIIATGEGLLFFEKGGELIEAGRITAADASGFAFAVAGMAGTTLDHKTPTLSSALPVPGHPRIEINIPPLCSQASFVIRKHSKKIFTLDDYVASGALTQSQKAFLVEAVATKKNILVGGGTGSGKTSLTNALLAVLPAVDPGCRVAVVEDTRELQTTLRNVEFRTYSREHPSQLILKSLMRQKPDRVLLGELRDEAAWTLLEAWGTGHPGGITTTHANDACSSLSRVRTLCKRAGIEGVEREIAELVNVVLYVKKLPSGQRKVTEVAEVLPELGPGGGWQIRHIG